MADNDVAKSLADTFSFKKQRKALSDTIDKAKSFVGITPPATNTQPPSTSQDTATDAAYRAQRLAEVNKGFADSAAKDAAKTKPAPKVTPKTPSYKHGTDYVPKTGLAKLHKGEAVLPKEHADAYRSAANALSGEGQQKPKKEIAEIHTKKAKSGGYIHKHIHTHPEHHPSEEHVSANQDQMLDHMMQNMGTPNPGEQEADAGPQGAAAGAGAPEAAAQGAPQGM